MKRVLALLFVVAGVLGTAPTSEARVRTWESVIPADDCTLTVQFTAFKRYDGIRRVFIQIPTAFDARFRYRWTRRSRSIVWRLQGVEGLPIEVSVETPLGFGPNAPKLAC